MSVETFASWNEAQIDTKGRTYGNVKTRCPRCDQEKRRPGSDTPLSANISDGVWLCHRCGFTGKITTRHWTDDAPKPAPVYAKPEVSPTKTIVGDAVTFLTSRGIDPDMAAEVGVYSSPDGKALAFPYFKHGELVHVKYRAVNQKKFWATAGTELTFYGYDDCIGSDTVVICEGEMDRLAFLMSGFLPVVSVPNGAPAPNSKSGAKLDFLEGAEEVFKNAKKVIIATDNDEPGRVLANELVRRIGPERCYRVRWPEGCKDANDVLVREGAAALAEMADTARPEPISGIITGDDLTDRILDLYLNGSDTGLRIGYHHLDQIYRVREGLFTIVTGHSSHGKSTVLDQLLIKLVERHQWKIAIFSPEQQPLEKHQMQLIEQYAGMPTRDGPAMPKMPQDDLLSAHAWLSQYFMFILPEQPSVEEILERAKVLIFRMGIKGLVIDPWNEIEHGRPPHMNETEYVNHVLQLLRNFARTHGVHLWLVAHPTKMPNDDQGKEQIPKLQNISGSIHFRNKADVGITVYRDLSAGEDEVDVLVTKSRWLDYAKPGRVRFKFDKVTKRLHELGPVA